MYQSMVLCWFFLITQFAWSQEKAPRSFPNLDKNADKVLSLGEYCGSDGASPQQRLWRQQFSVFDFDGDGQLTLSEFAAVPRNTAPKDRTDLPDFYGNLVSEMTESLLEVAPEAATPDNWGTVADSLPWYLPEQFENWDSDHDGVVTAQELEQQLGVAFGQIRGDGTALRRGTGHVFYAYRFHEFLDRDHSGGLSADELTLERKYDLEAATDFVKQGDADASGELELVEVDALDLYWVDVASEFLQRDVDQDGSLSEQEVAAFPSWDKQVGQLLHGFDRDQSGTWDLAEYIQSPAGNRLLNWGAKLRDTNDDGVLDIQEFWSAVKLAAYHNGMNCLGLVGIVFDQLDRDQNQKLDLDEITFDVSVDNVPTRHAFPLLDRDQSGELSIEELTGFDSFVYSCHSRWFGLSDLDHSGELNRDEFLSTVDWMSIRKTEIYVRQRLMPKFQQLDTDQDRVLGEEEWARQNAGQTTHQDFAIQDTDSDGRLSFIEFCGLRGVAPFQHRGPVADPIAHSVDQVMDKVELKAQTKSVLKLIERVSTGLKPSDFIDMDAERDYESHELEIALASLFGMRSRDGALLRKPTGEIFNLRMFHNLDLDDDGELSRDEVVLQHWQGPEKGAEIFAAHDLNGDDLLSLKELAVGRYCWLDTTHLFRSFDDDVDGKLSEQELRAHLPAVDHPDRDYLMRAFDTDGDGSLTFVEFRRTPCANPLPRNALPEDSNDDAVLNLSEFQIMFENRYRGLTGLYFRQFDRDGDGTLSLDEYQFKYDLHEIPPDVVFTMLDLDHNGQLEVSEISSVVSDMPVNSPKERESRIMAIEEALMLLDQDQDSELSLTEFVDSGHIIPLRMMGRPAPLPSQSHPAVASHAPGSSSQWRPYAVVSINVLILAVVFGLVYRSKRVNSGIEED